MLVAAYFSIIFTYGWTAFVGPIVSTFGWSMTQISLGSSLRSLENGVFNPIWGPIIDRFSAKKLMIFGVTMASLGIVCLSQAKNLAMYYAGFLISGMGSSLIGGMLMQTVISRWFRKDVGKANGLFYACTAASGVAVPLVVKLIDNIGWRSTLLYAAIGFMAIGIPLSLVVRNRPQDYGLLPDGRKLDTSIAGINANRAYDFGTTVKEALKMRAFWYLGFIFLWQFSAFSTVSLYSIPYLTNLGISRATAATVVSLFTLVAAIGRIPIGTAADFFRKSYVMAFTTGMMCLGVFLFWFIGDTSPSWIIVVFGIVYGCGLCGLTPLRGPIMMEYFGVKKLGTIFGLISIFTSVGQIASQPLAGWIYDTYHSYKAWWLILFITGVIALVIVLMLPKAKDRSLETATAQQPINIK
jgi:sugar phosphate permease